MHDAEIATYLTPLIGLQLMIARRAADLRNFQFGPIRQADGGSVGSYALHIQCPWRLEDPDGIVTGRSDLWEPADPTADVDFATWDYDTHPNLQDAKLAEVLHSSEPDVASIINHTDLLVVEAVHTDRFGGLVLMLSGGYRLVVFPAGRRGEHWRCFQPGSTHPHIVSEAKSISLHL